MSKVESIQHAANQLDSQAGKRARTESSGPPSPPRLSQLSVDEWFENDDERISYHQGFSRKTVLKPRYIGDEVLPEERFPEFWRLIDLQGLRQFLFMNVGYYPRFIAAAYTTFSLQDDLNDARKGTFFLTFKVVERTFQANLDSLAADWGLKNEGATFKGGNNPHGSWNEFDKLDAMRELRLEPASAGKYSVSKMTVDHRLLLLALSYVLLPRRSNHGTTTEEDLIILWAMGQSFLGLAHLWTILFRRFHFDLAGEKMLAAIPLTQKSLNQMRRDFSGRGGEAGDAAEGAAEGVAADVDVQMENAPPHTEAGTSSQVPAGASVPPRNQSDAMEFMMRSIGEIRTLVVEGFTQLSDRVDNLDITLASQGIEIRSLRDEAIVQPGDAPAEVDPEPSGAVPVQQDDITTQD
ncbi:hypothetical protein PIB30_028217 [Stylosanthes scabra]|uniref:Uncharacterized protein n=1 Tax=Stylosanthes scabra TaxID=79078 RepID=A0ABU6TCS1_9FABA|nr:hypothetical protein [Stylosanthes scabra]